MSSMQLVYSDAMAPRPVRAMAVVDWLAVPSRPARAIQMVDWLTILFLLAVAGLSALVTSQTTEQYRWEKASIAAFSERHMGTPDVVVFDRAGREKVVAEVSGCVVILLLEVLLIWVVPLQANRWREALPASAPNPRHLHANAKRRFQLARGIVSPNPTDEFEAIGRVVDRLGDTRRGTPPCAAPSLEDLHADAERCFRLAQGAVSFNLATELEALGHAFEHEAHELERRVPQSRLVEFA